MSKWRKRPILLVYIGLTLWGLITLANRFAPFYGRTVAGCEVSYVYDGDTIAMRCGGDEMTARLQGFDTPETRDPGCEAEAAHGARATARLRALVAGASEIGLSGVDHDRYSRALVHLVVDGRDVGDTLIAEGLAVAYTGGQRINWCDRLRAG